MIKFLKRIFQTKPKYREVSKERVLNDDDIVIRSSLQVREPNKEEVLIRELNKTATILKKNDIDEAIRCLEKIYPLLDKVPTSYPITTYLRLPLFLQEAGRMSEAEKIFDSLYKSRNDERELVVIEAKWNLAKNREQKRLNKIKTI